MAEGSSNELSNLSELDNQQNKISIPESDEVDTGSIPDVGFYVNIETTGSSVSTISFLSQLSAEVKGFKTAVAEASQDHDRQIIRTYDRVCELACAFANFCKDAGDRLKVIDENVREAIFACNKRMDKALQKAEVSESDQSASYRTLANRYFTGIEMFRKRLFQIQVVSKFALTTSNYTIDAAKKMDGVSNQTPNASKRLSSLDFYADVAINASILACKTEYVTLKALRKCWNVLYSENETARSQTRNAREELCENKQEKSRCSNFSLISRKKNLNKISQIDERLHELKRHFENHNISPLPSESDKVYVPHDEAEEYKKTWRSLYGSAV